MTFNEKWEEAIEQAKYELDYSSDGFYERSRFGEVVKRAKEIVGKHYSVIAKEKYKVYLQSPEWEDRKIRVMQNNNMCCVDCYNRAHTAHHLTYDNVGTNREIDDCVSICNKCHVKRHLDNDNGDYYE